MRPPLVNATLTRIAGGGLSEDYDQAEGSDTVRWSGSADAYVGEELLAEIKGQSHDEVGVTRLVVDRDIGSVVERDDMLTYELDGGSHSRKAQNVTHYRVFGTTVVRFYDK